MTAHTSLAPMTADELGPESEIFQDGWKLLKKYGRMADDGKYTDFAALDSDAREIATAAASQYGPRAAKLAEGITEAVIAAISADWESKRGVRVDMAATLPPDHNPGYRPGRLDRRLDLKPVDKHKRKEIAY